jgi:aminobenzoyl-glutamate transport protein
MKSKLSLIPLLLLGSCVVALSSWVANLYGVGEVQSLLSAEGVRHEVRSALRQYMACPELGIFLVMAPGVGLAWGSGWLGAVRRMASQRQPLSRRERRSLNWAFSVLGLYAVVIALAVVSPWACLRSITGGLYPSPFIEGLPLILSLGLALVGWVYGYAAGSFRGEGEGHKGQGESEISVAFALPLRRWALYPVHLFFVVRLFAQLTYTRLPEALGLSQTLMVWAFHLAAIALLWHPAYRQSSMKRSQRS